MIKLTKKNYKKFKNYIKKHKQKFNIKKNK